MSLNVRRTFEEVTAAADVALALGYEQPFTGDLRKRVVAHLRESPGVPALLDGS
jgi:hypothetical protein